MVVLLGLPCSVFSAGDSSHLFVWVTVQPQKYLLERIGGESVVAEVLVRPDESPEMYAPSVKQIARLARADIYFGVGMPIETLLFKRMDALMSEVQIVTSEALRSDTHSAKVNANHSCGACTAQGDVDPHVWLDPVKMIEMVEIMRDMLSAARPEDANEFRNNADLLIKDLVALDQEIREQLKPYAERLFFINHPSLGHFANRYGLVQMSIEQSSSISSAGRIAGLIKEAREAAVSAIFTQPEFGRTTARILADALEVEVVELNVLPVDYISGMRLITNQISSGFD